MIDLKHYKLTGDVAECQKAADSLHKYGVLCLRDEVSEPPKSCAALYLRHTQLTALAACVSLYIE